MGCHVQIIEKPDWVSWEDIRQCLIEAHSENLEKGIMMLHTTLPADKLEEIVTPNGCLLVALDGKKLVGTAAILQKSSNSWYTSGPYAYLGFAGVIPAYKGRGIYKDLTLKREEYARQRGFSVLVFNTNEKNQRVQQVAKKNGFVYVDYKMSSTRDHFDVYMAKWLTPIPFSLLHCRLRYLTSKVSAHFRKCASDVRRLLAGRR